MWLAWQTLSPGRPRVGAGMGGLVSGPIPFEVVERYAARFGPRDADGLRDLLELLGHMDSIYLAEEAKRLELKEPKGKKKRDRNRRT